MERRVLILGTRGRDAPVIEQVLNRAGMETSVSADARTLLMEMDRGAGAAVVTEESLGETDWLDIRRWLDAQPSWADFPFVVLALRGRTGSHDSLREITDALGNVVVLERPINAQTLTSAVRSALRARDRQYQARRHWIDRENDERRLWIALSAGRLGAWSLDLATRTLSGSERFKAHFGLPVDQEISTRDLFASFHPDDRALVQSKAYDSISTHAEVDLECRVVWPDGQVRWLQINGRIIYGDDSRPTSISGVSLDVTSRRQSQEDLQKRVDAAVAESERAQVALVQAQKMEAVGQLTGGIAHDFNNLLTAIGGNLDLIERRAQDDRIKIMVGRARHAADRAAKLTGQLLAFSRSQRLDLRPQPIDRLIRGMRDLVARTIGPTIRVTADLGAPGRFATADGNQLELALLNLAINARDAMPEGGELTIRTRLEAATDAGRQGWIVLSVIDTGSGIAPDILPRVFDPFFTTKPVGKGTGLGLSQVHGIAHQSGGSVTINSTLGQGTTIEIWLREVQATGDIEEGPPEQEKLYLGHGRVLVIDDDADVRRFVTECLETLGFSVTQADHGRAGLDVLDQAKPDLIIVDFAMPGMNGAQVAAAARKRRAGLPIILATGYAETDQVDAAFSKDFILRKPFQIHDLSRAVRHALEQPPG